MSGIVLAFDTASEQLAVAVGVWDHGALVRLAGYDAPARRRANTELLGRVEQVLAEADLTIGQVDRVVVGRGPGSFTGVRIGVATAKGLAQGLGVGLHGVGTLDAVARGAVSALADRGTPYEGLLGVVADAMRSEVYPALFRVSAGRVERLSADEVARPERAAARWASELAEPVLLLGDGLGKHSAPFVDALGERAILADEALWVPTGSGLLAAAAARWRDIEAESGDPAVLLPVYTRLSDAEEAERARQGESAASEIPASGVARVGRPEAEDPTTSAGAQSAPEGPGVVLRPLRDSDIEALHALELAVFDDPWTIGNFRDELAAPGRVWLVAEDAGEVVGYAGAAVLEGEAHVMNLCVREDRRRAGVGRLMLTTLRERVIASGASIMTLEVRPGAVAAIELYRSLGFEVLGRRPRYYASSGQDALLMWVDLPGVEEPPVCSAESGGGEGLVLAIETSCDETAAAVMRRGHELLSNVVASQVDFHARFGGVVPEIASRKHAEAVVGVVDEALREAGAALGCLGALPLRSLDAIAVTQGPGLVGALVVGLAYAKGLSLATGVPVVGVNHLEGHIFANVLADPEVEPPLVALIVSGGHTSLVSVPAWGEYHTLGETLDDAAGEAFDKVAKVLGLGYPGGPVLSRLAAEGDPAAIDFPRAMMRSGDYRFSLSGLKTAVINHIRHEREAGREIDVPDLAASFQAAIVDVQVAKAVRAVGETGARSFVLGGGVAANPALREALRSAIEPLGVHVSVPPLALCTDNAAMIAAAGHYRFARGERLGLDAEALPALRLDASD